MDEPFAVAVVGMGPRGLTVFERLAAYLREVPVRRPVRIFLIDDGRPGSGRIWRRDQPPWLTMNTVAGELTMFSGPRDGDVCRPGAGCTFLEWAASHPDPEVVGLGPDSYAPRHVYGEYLEHVYDRVRAGLEGIAPVRHVRGRATAVRRDSRYTVDVVTDGDTVTLSADAVVLATGHPASTHSAAEAGLRAAAAARDDLSYLPGDSAADLPLDEIAAGCELGVIGMGLSFHDLLLSLTVGRGGRFRTEAGGDLVYEASGREPRIFAGSRTGLPIRTRGVNQKPATQRHRARFLTPAALAESRLAALRRTGSPALDFGLDIGPLLLAEVNLVYLTTLARRRLGTGTARRLAGALVAQGPDVDVWPKIAAACGLTDVGVLDLDRLARPFADLGFADPAAFRLRLTEILRDDLTEALHGNVGSPLKAALDVIRDVREALRSVVEFGGLTPASHERDFQARVAPVLSLLSTGPPPIRTAQLLALLRAGIVDIVGPDIRYGYDAAQGRFRLESPRVAGSTRHVNALICCRLPVPHIRHRDDPLTRQLLRDGTVSEFVNDDGRRSYGTGGLRITPAENRVVAANGAVLDRFYAVGIPTENTRWFTQIGNGRPGVPTAFQREADAIALSIVRGIIWTTGRRAAA